MNDTLINKQQFLKALIDYVETSGNYNSIFYKQNMVGILKISEIDFDIVLKKLGEKYCFFAEPNEGGDRYKINYSECLALQEQYEQDNLAGKRHKQIIRLAVLVAILGAVDGLGSGKANRLELNHIFKYKGGRP